MSSISSEYSFGLGLEPSTAAALSRFARRRRVLLTLRGIAVGIVFLITTMLLVAACDYIWLISDGVRWLLSLCGYALTFAAMWWLSLRHLGSRDPRAIARQLESADPRLREDLLSAVELADPRDANGAEGFRKRLQRSVARRTATLDLTQLLPVGLVQRWLFSGFIVMLACALLLLIPKMQFGRRIARAMLPGFAIQRASLTEVVIVEPSPASGFVAEGDAVGVIVRLGGSKADEVLLQWRTNDGTSGESLMSPRVRASAASGDAILMHENLFAANLSVGTSPLEYRVVAGDAITLWHRLTPLPRPRVELFKKRYRFPSYAKLSDRIEEAEHGDLKALVGTSAEVTVRFDEPVENVTLRFGNRGVTSNLDSISGSDREFKTTIPIKTPAQYQIDATSARSGLNNPFSSQYTITPVIDTPPIVRWAAGTSETMIVSPLDVVSFAASAVDDLPIDRVLQEFQINAEPLVHRFVTVSESGRELQLQWDWDLMRRIDGQTASIKLAGGDIIRTRVVAIDRRGQRGESTFIELLIAEEGFDADRHNRLEEVSQLTVSLANWAERVRQVFETLREPTEKGQAETLHAAAETVAKLDEETADLQARLRRVVETSRSDVEAGTFELLGRAVIDIDHKLARWFAAATHVVDDGHPAWEKNRQTLLGELAKESRRFSQDASRIDQYARANFGQQLTVAITGDAMSLRNSLRPLLEEDSKLPPERVPRYLVLAVGRLKAIDELVGAHQDALPESTTKHLEGWHKWSDSWVSRFNDAVTNAPKPEELRKSLRQFDTELRDKITHSMIDGRIAATLTGMLREIRVQVAATNDRMHDMSARGKAADQALERAAKESDSAKVAALNHDAQFEQAKYGVLRDHALARLTAEEQLHRSRPHVDLQYAADTNLMHRAIENVTAGGFQPYREESASVVHEKLGRAFQVIEAKHEADMWLRELQSLRDAERRLEPTAIAKVDYPLWIERFSTGLEWPVQTLRNAGVDWQELEKIDRIRYSDDYNQARNRITTRRWSGEDMVTAEAALDRMQHELAEGLAVIEPRVIEARETIQKYVLTLSEQARQAAEQAKQAQQRTESRPDSQAETAEQLAEQQKEAQQATRDTLEALVDMANTSDIADAQQRELARDADAAAAQIQDAAERAKKSMQEATKATVDKQRSEALDQTAEALEDLATALEQTADHFERAEKGEDVSESREQLREAEESLQMAEQLDQRYDRAQAMANAAQSSPAELMKQLEQELQRNEPMQQELSEISERAAEAAQRSLEQAARDESSLNQSLERSDVSFQEQKTRAARQLANLARRTATVDQALLNATERAVGWANTPETRPKLDEARRQLRDSVQKANEMGSDQAVLSKIQETAAEMARATKQASELLAEVEQVSQQASDENIHKDEASRKRTRQDVEKFERDARSQRVRETTNLKNDWASAERDAGRRVEQAQRQERDAERAKQALEQRIKREQNNREALQPQVDQLQQRIADAKQAEQAAKETREFAKQQAAETEKRGKELEKRRIEPLEKPNPAAELAQRMTDQAGQELADIIGALQEVSQQTQFADELRASQPQTNHLAGEQQRIQRDVETAVDQLQRASRHEQRLGATELAKQLSEAADAVADSAAEAAAEAAKSIGQAAQDSAKSPEANRRVGQATEQINEAAKQLAELLASASGKKQTQAAPPPPGQATPSQQRAEQLAQTLDELDRAMAQQQGQPQQGQTPGQESAQDQQGSQGQEGQPGQQANQGPQTAAEASPTLAGAMDAQAQSAARQRQQQMNPPSPGQSQNGKPQPTASRSNPATESGTGQMPDGGSVDTTGVDRLGGDWGQLRERRTEDAAEGRSATIAPQYRREIEAYFRAIARKAGEASQ